MPLGRPRKQFLQRGVELRRDREEDQNRGIVDTSLEAPDHIGMHARLEGERLLRQVALFTAFPNFLTETPQDRLRAHTQGSVAEQDTV